MNKTTNINPQVCRTCGKCCKFISIGYPKDLLLNIKGYSEQQEEESLIVFSDLQRYLELQTDKIYVVEYTEEFDVIFDFVCEIGRAHV